MKDLVKSLNDIALGNHSFSIDDCLEFAVKASDLKGGGRKGAFRKDEMDQVMAEHIEKGGMIHLMDNVTVVSFDINTGRFLIRAASKRSRQELMSNYEQDLNGAISTAAKMLGSVRVDEDDDGLEPARPDAFIAPVAVDDSYTVFDEPLDEPLA